MHGPPVRTYLHYCRNCWAVWLRLAVERNKSDWMVYAKSLHDAPDIAEDFRRAGREGAKHAMKAPSTDYECFSVQPNEIFFTHNEIYRTFHDTGLTLDETLYMIKTGELHPDDLPSIRVTEFQGKLFTLDNRRLFVLRVAAAWEKCSPEGVTVKFIPFNDPLLQEEVTSADGKFTDSRFKVVWYHTESDGRFVVVEGGSKFERLQHKDLQQRQCERNSSYAALSPLSTSSSFFNLAAARGSGSFYSLE